jgi:pimeloyl-ACP methyl ester carboxylesterase
VFGNNAGAVIGLELTARFPDLVRGAIAREPPDVDALRRGPPIVPAFGEASRGYWHARTARALAEALDVRCVELPGAHLLPGRNVSPDLPEVARFLALSCGSSRFLAVFLSLLPRVEPPSGTV